MGFRNKFKVTKMVTKKRKRNKMIEREKEIENILEAK